MAASLRHCGSTKKYFIYFANQHSSVFRQVEKKYLHTRHLTSCYNIKLNDSLSHQKVFVDHTLVKVLGVRYASTDKSAVLPPTPEGYILDTPPVPLADSAQEAAFSLPELTVLGEPTLQSLGFAQSYFPSGFYESMLQLTHVGLDLPWWTTIALVTVCVRLLMLPVFIMQKKALINFQNTNPELMLRKQRLAEAKLRENVFEMNIYQNDYQKYAQENKHSSLAMFLGPACQGIVFISIFGSLRRMAELPIMSLKEGGTWWFVDLTLSDPYYAIPIITSLTMSLMFELGTESKSVSQMPFAQKCFFRCLPVLSFFFISRFATAFGIHFLTNNLFSLLQNVILTRPKVIAWLKMPVPNKKVMQEVKEKNNFVGEVKKKLEVYRNKRQLDDRKAVATMDFKQAGEGPVPKTYSYNPKQKKLTTS